MNILKFPEELLKFLEENPKTKDKIDLLKKTSSNFLKIYNEDGSFDLHKLYSSQPELQIICNLLGDINVVSGSWFKNKDKIYIENYLKHKNFNFEIKDSDGEFISFQLNSDNDIYFELYPFNNCEWQLLKVGSKNLYWNEKIGNINDEKLEEMLKTYIKISNYINNNSEE